MPFKPKKSSLFILAVAALTCSRGIFALINDPEGPNLLIVVVFAALIFLIFLAIYWLGYRDRR